MDEPNKSSDTNESSLLPLETRFGALLNISAESLVSLITDVRRKLTTDKFTTASIIKRIEGAHNLIHIAEFNDKLRYVVRLPFSGCHDRFTETAKRALISKVKMMQFIKKRTMIPMPEVYDYDASFDNTIKAPYVVESFIQGTPIFDAWFNNSDLMPLEERRLRILDSVAEAMAQLRGFNFDEIGSVEVDDQGHRLIHPCYSYKVSDKDMWYEESGPYESTVGYLRARLAEQHSGTGKKDESLEFGCRMFLDMMISCLPRSTNRNSDDHETFVLAVPQFDSINILVDDQCHVTGFINWDGVQTMPRFLGYAIFPSWITRDLDPLVYNYPGDAHEDSPDLLKRYRLLYNRKMQGLLRGVADARFVNKTHIFEAICVAVTNPITRMEIVRTLVAKAFPASLDGALRLMVKAGEGNLLRRDKERLMGGFEALLSVHF
ncbi:hypothetical protein BO71DRAFT_458078 [Aspergillus ellipticus CBS 707.79]|uniref:Uncharacterized protein n=1 Tax=Aspergillus ellipticus CBS 707.79 TaxID=1448320 RepID=A0A319D3V3_9EURO|nr:hypothetical protein BO71DRAFT_458078 [Aspergillus ellipticus CBS 707.79]